MTQLQVLRQFEYTIPASSVSFTGGKNKTGKFFSEDMPLMKMIIDFDEAGIMIEANWQFILNALPHNARYWSASQRERIKIEATICSETSPPLDDVDMGRLVLPVEGTIRDGVILSACSGVIIIDGIQQWYGKPLSTSAISIHMHDWLYDGCEIALTFPVYMSSENTEHN